jgi:hypothetical protein
MYNLKKSSRSVWSAKALNFLVPPYVSFLTQNNCALRHQCFLRINITYFPVLTDIFKGGALWFLCGRNRIFKCYLDDLTLIYFVSRNSVTVV